MVHESVYTMASSNLSRRDATSKQDTLTGKQILDRHWKVLILACVETLEAEIMGTNRSDRLTSTLSSHQHVTSQLHLRLI
jgi:hypothetical protein